ncbi:MAG: enoyl-CoA hydratase [Spirochaetota bacterium]|nr:enoyl-CoA hydratase [Spirochaetota bacterium]
MENIILTKEDQIAILTINRPNFKNALDGKTYEEFGIAIDDVKSDSSIRVLIITGAGDSFCSGLDLSYAASMKDQSMGDFRAGMKRLQSIFNFEEIYKPVIAAVKGYALGNGCDIALASDFIIAGESAKFAMAYTNLGLIPDLGGTFRLPRLVGPAKAKELILTGEKIDAKTALDIGIAGKLVPDEKLMDEANKFAQKLAKRSPIALSLAKKAINNSLGTNLYNSLEYEAYMQNICMNSNDTAEAVMAFLEKREPNFTGT